MNRDAWTTFISGARPGGRKFHNVATNGYASAKEARRAAELKLLEHGKVIEDLREQIPFVVIPRQYEDGKVIERETVYVADFVYREDGEMVVEDTKGVRTKEYIIKRKLMLFVYGHKIRET